MIKPDTWVDEGFIACSMEARLLWIGCFSLADDSGRGCADARSLKAKVFPGDDMTTAQVLGYRKELEKNLRILIYEVDGKEYYQLMRWKRHQKVDHPSESTCPPPPDSGTVLEDAGTDTGTVPEDAGIIPANELVRLINKDIMSTISYLNAATGRQFNPKTKATTSHLSARFREKYTLADFKAVIDHKVKQWSGDPKMAEYLRPETLFGTKFDSYLQAARKPTVTPKTSSPPMTKEADAEGKRLQEATFERLRTEKKA